MSFPTGPRIIFKDDRDSSIGRGAVLYSAHFTPAIAEFLFWAPLVAPKPWPEAIVVSEAWRPQRNPMALDLHERCQAFDLSLNPWRPLLTDSPSWARKVHSFGMQGALEMLGRDWATALGEQLSPLWDFECHGEGHNLHLHGELDC